MLFGAFMVPFVGWLFGRGIVTGVRDDDPAMVLASTLGFVIATGFLILMPVARLRTRVVSTDSTLRIRNGLIEHIVPVDDISGVVMVDYVGRRGSGPMCRPAIALVPGSGSDRRERWAHRSRWSRAARRGWYFLARKDGDVPLAAVPKAVFSTARQTRALLAVQAWHDWARGDGRSGTSG